MLLTVAGCSAVAVVPIDMLQTVPMEYCPLHATNHVRNKLVTEGPNSMGSPANRIRTA